MPIVLPRVKITREYVESHYRLTCEDMAKRASYPVYVAVISLLSMGPQYPVDIQWVTLEKMRIGDAFPALIAMECLGLIEPVGRPIDATKPHGTTQIRLTVEPSEALERIRAVLSGP